MSTQTKHDLEAHRKIAQHVKEQIEKGKRENSSSDENLSFMDALRMGKHPLGIKPITEYEKRVDAQGTVWIQSRWDGKWYPEKFEDFERRSTIERIVHQNDNPEDFKTYKNDDPRTRYNRLPLLKRRGVEMFWYPGQAEEYLRCHKDPIYFLENYASIIHPDYGAIKMVLRDYQRDMIKIINSPQVKNSIFKLPRQVGKTATIGGDIAHYATFNRDKTIAILAHKRSMADEILSRVKEIISGLPDFLQQGIIEWNKSSIELENGTRIKTYSSDPEALRGMTAQYVYVDEVAFIPQYEQAEKAFLNTVKAGRKSKIIMTSTPNGLNHFYDRWRSANAEGLYNSGFFPYSANWFDVKDRLYSLKTNKFDDGWDFTISSIMESGSIEVFKQEHQCEFVGSSSTLISSQKLIQMTGMDVQQDSLGIRYYKYPKNGHSYIGVVDTAEGGGKDYHAAHIIDVTQFPFEQVAVLHSNSISPLELPTILFSLLSQYNMAPVCIENASTGQEVANNLNQMGYPNIIREEYGYYGIKPSEPKNLLGNTTLRDLIENNKFIINCRETIKELRTYIVHNRTWKAESGFNDDLVTSLRLFGYLTTLKEFRNYMVDPEFDLAKEIFGDKLDVIEREIAPIYIMSSSNDDDFFSEQVRLYEDGFLD